MSEIDFSLFGENAAYLRELLDLYSSKPDSVAPEWRSYLEQLLSGQIDSATLSGHSGGWRLAAPGADVNLESGELRAKAERLVDSFRRYGHLAARFNPLSRGVDRPPQVPEIDINSYAFSSEELASTVRTDFPTPASGDSLSALIESLKQTYCSTAGFEYMHITDHEQREWLRAQIETRYPARDWYTFDERKALLRKLIETELFDSELHLRYPGSKRFSLRGAETLNSMLMTMLDRGALLGISQVVLGLSHRGRINVLGNISGQPLEEIVAEFEDRGIASLVGAGDVKYHLGHEATIKTVSGAAVQLSIASNPSHLESVDGVVEGKARARQDRLPAAERSQVLPVLIHGDAAFVGQGVAWETMNFSQTVGYSTLGTLHIVVNNQVGFTTNPDEGRSSIYCTDLAKGIEAPIIHVNSEDIEACSWVVELALDYRLKFKRDVVIDLYCYRKFGHNEADDPSFTQPVMYSEIRARKSLADMYANYLAAEEILSEEESKTLGAEVLTEIRKSMQPPEYQTSGPAVATYGRIKDQKPSTAVKPEELAQVAQAMLEYPPDFKPYPKIEQIMRRRADSVAPGHRIDWGTAEELAFGSLVLDGCSVRLSGQDCGRGTFAQRHLELHHLDQEEHFYPLGRMAKRLGCSATFEVFNSTLSEAAVLGFEWGYGTAAGKNLVLWEAQFGDFANGAQVIIDQYITSSEAKWGERSGVTLLLPHGYEGQGPEHSNARVERFLTLSAHGNLAVIVPSTASQYFHLLRRQGLTEIKRPLIVFSPKSLLRLPEATSPFEDLVTGKFNPILVSDCGAGSAIEHLVFLTGKIYYELAPELQKLSNTKVRVIRIEELYPFPIGEITECTDGLEIKSVTWAQEEPANMGAFRYLERRLRRIFKRDINYAGRSSSGSTACGSYSRHQAEQKAICDELLRIIRSASSP